MYIGDVDYDAFIVPELFVDLHYCELEQVAPMNSSVSYINESIRANEWFDTQVPITTSGLTSQHLSAKFDVLVISNRIKPSGWNVAVNNYDWDSNSWNFASWGRNDACDSRWRTDDCRATACVKNSW
ncbi:hypothetical protein IHE45_02G052800 [Dioscorea alata]|uniref:Uncharacterized protein n=1 Tax=Dioscorea alata TaxID=55571 RepID=A0ACB7WQH0_DIOAL|nr:hypothetical protein IHE45_02G052800 [Dioscorea alata]